METSSVIESDKAKQRIVITSLFAAIFIVTIKFFAAYFSGSLAILSELFHSSIGLVACVATLFSIKYSVKQPNTEHNYGHDKIESLSALFQVLILIFICVYLIYESVVRIINPVQVRLNVWIFSSIIICVAIDFSLSRALSRMAKKTETKVLESDSLHFSADILSSIVVIISMIFTYFRIPPIYKNHPLADPLSAMLVSLIIIFTNFRFTKRTFDSLIDRIPKEIKIEVENIIKNSSGVISIKSLRLRGSVDKLFVDSTVEVSRTKMAFEIRDLTDSLEKKISEKYPNSDVIIHAEPIATKDESINDRIRFIVNSEGYHCHDIMSRKINDKIFCEIHVGIANTNDLETVHNQIDLLKSKINNEIPLIDSLNIFIDEPDNQYFESNYITDESNDIKNKVTSILKSEKSILRFHDMNIHQTKDGINLSLNCEFDKNTPLNVVQKEVTFLESRIYLILKESYKRLNNVIIHTEPIGH